MDKASKAIRRSGVRLRSMSSGHGNLQMVISQLGEVRSTFKSFAQAQTTVAEDFMQWSGSSQNRAIDETFVHLNELAAIWAEVQRDFADQLKEFRTNFELILEGERHVSQAREILAVREQREAKLRKDLKKLSKKAPGDEVQALKEKLIQAEKARSLAHNDVVERVNENEAVKMIRVKEGLVRLGASYCDLAQRCLVVFSTHHAISSLLPDVEDRDLHDIKYTGGGHAKRLVQEAKDQVRLCRRTSLTPKTPLPDDPPPPYTPSMERLDTASSNAHNGHSVVPRSSHPHHPLYPSAPSASIDSFRHHSQPGDGPPNYTHATNRYPGAPHTSPGQHTVYPSNMQHPRNIYPDLPNPSRGHPYHLPHSPSLPESYSPPEIPSPHSNSAPNLAEECTGNASMVYPSLNTHDHSSFNETTYHPDTSSSSPNLASGRYQKTCPSEVDPPYNPTCEWLPVGENTEKVQNSGDKRCNKKVESSEDKRCNKPPETQSVRPRVGKNPFFDSDSEDEEGRGGGEDSLAGSLRKTSIR